MVPLFELRRVITFGFIVLLSPFEEWDDCKWTEDEFIGLNICEFPWRWWPMTWWCKEWETWWGWWERLWAWLESIKWWFNGDEGEKEEVEDVTEEGDPAETARDMKCWLELWCWWWFDAACKGIKWDDVELRREEVESRSLSLAV